MTENFITNIFIKKVRHLSGIDISLSNSEKKHLILTGRNGSGKTSVLEEIKSFLLSIINGRKRELLLNIESLEKFAGFEKNLESLNKKLESLTEKVDLCFNSENEIIEKYSSGSFILAYYNANRVYKAELADNIEKVRLQEKYFIDEKANIKLIKYLLDLKATQSFAINEGNHSEAEKIKIWFDKFEEKLKQIFEDKDLRLEFDYSKFKFTIQTLDREPFGFNEMSDGYSALLDIVVDLMLKMENKAREFYDVGGIVLIDEIEAHLHIELQEKVLTFLTEFFPKIQFIITTHSPFVLKNAENCIIYDLESNTYVTNGLNNYTVSGVVNGYFKADILSVNLREKFERYKFLANKSELSNTDYAELAEIENSLDEVPDFLTPDFSAEYQRIKLELETRE